MIVLMETIFPFESKKFDTLAWVMNLVVVALLNKNNYFKDKLNSLELFYVY